MVSSETVEGDGLMMLEAEQIFLLLKKNHRVSRNARAEWYFNNLNNVITIPKRERIDSGISAETEVISAVPTIPPPDWDWDTSHLYKYIISPATTVTFLSHTHHLVFCLDLSPSAARVDACRPCVLFDETVSAFQKCIQGLVRPFNVPGSQILFRPTILVTVIAYSPYFLPGGQQVLAAGWVLQHETVDQLFRTVQHQLHNMEERLSIWTSVVEQQRNQQREDAERFVGDLFESPGDNDNENQAEIEMSTPEAAFVIMVRFGMLALQSLPESSGAGIIFLTDGVAGSTDAASLELLLNQLRHNSISCSFIQVGSRDENACSPFGYLPNLDWMEFLATTTFGTALFDSPEVDKDYEYPMNLYHKAFLTWGFHKPLDWRSQTETDASKWKLQHSYFSPSLGTARRKVSGNALNSPLLSVLSCRLREGFTITEVLLNDELIEVRLTLLWRPSIQVNYILRGQWPLGQGTSTYEVYVDEPYDFFFDVTRNGRPVSKYRQVLINTYLSLLKVITETDQLLTHLYSFSTNPAYYTVPEGIRSGVPLFYLPPNETSIVNASNDFAFPQFASFWRPVCVLDLSYWQRWLHSHRIRIVLEHDRPLPKHLWLPSATGRYHPVLCRQALAALNAELRQSTTFVLLENHSYVGLLKNENESVPGSYYLIRLTLKPPFVLLRIAFLGGTPGAIRHKVVSSLKHVIESLTIVLRGNDHDSSQRIPGRQITASSSGTAVNCCHVFSKPLEQMVIRYEKVPSDIWRMQNYDANHRGTGNLSRGIQNLGHPATGRINPAQWSTLRQYLYSRRWIWCVQSSPDMPVTLNSVARILGLLSKLRMQEGLLFSHSYSGIVGMIVELQLKINNCPLDLDVNEANVACTESDDSELPCIVQYVIFPPRNTAAAYKDSSEDDLVDGSDSAEQEGQLEIVTECWIEPQNGFVCNSPHEREHYEGLDYKQLAEMFYQRDADCITALVTFEHLSLMCQNISIPAERFAPDHGRLNAGHANHGDPYIDPAVTYVPFRFELPALLPKCSKASLNFSTFVQEYPLPVSHSTSSSDFANEKLFELLTNHLSDLSHRELTLGDDECRTLLQVLQEPTTQTSYRSGRNDTEVDSTNTYTTPRGSCSTPRSPRDASSITPQSRNAQLTPQAFSSRGTNTIPTPQCNSSGTNSSCNTTASKRVPLWRCFVKGISTSHVVLILIPATFQDLKLLSVTDDALSNDNPTGLKKVLPDSVKKGSADYHLPGDRLAYQETTDGTSTVDDDRWSQRTGGWGSQPTSLGPTRTNSLDVNRRPLVSSLARVRTGSIDTPTLERTYSVGAYAVAEAVALRTRSRPGSGDSPSSAKTSVSTSARLVTASSCQPEQPRPEVAETSSVHASVTLPVYVFDCPLSGLISELLCPDSSMKDDICRDHTFTMQGDLDHPHGDATDPDSVAADDEKGEFTSEGQRYDSTPILLKYCNIVETLYCKSLGQALFTSLQQGYSIHSRDVQAAMDLCKETLLEVDITSFLQNICGHLKDFRAKSLVEYIRQQQESAEETVLLNQQFPLSLLRLHKPCTSLVHLHRIIKTRFEEILHMCFKPVPSQQDYYFYCPSDWQLESPNSEQHDNAFDSFVTDHSVDYPRSRGADSTVGSSSASHTSSPSADMDGDIDDELEKDSSPLSPLFLHLTTTLRSNKDITSQPINSIPTCLGDLLSCITGSPSLLDLSGLKITLDFLCLTFRSDEEIQNIVQGHQNMRTTSFCSSSSGHLANNADNSTDEEEDLLDDDEDDKGSTTSSVVPFQRHLKHLPEIQSKDVRAAVAEIEWMIRDEIVAFLLDSFPIEESTLSTVVEHIQSSPHRPSCRKTVVPLQFVLNPEESYRQFVTEFNKFTMQGYRLIECGQYIYLTEDFVRRFRRAHGSLHPPLGASSEKNVGELSEKPHDSVALSATAEEASTTTKVNETGENKDIGSTLKTVAIEEVTETELTLKETHFVDSCELEAVEAVFQASADQPPKSVVEIAEQVTVAVTVVEVGVQEDVVGGKNVSGLKKRRESEHQSDASSTVRSVLHTEDGYDGGSSETNDECEWLRDLDIRRPRMPPFWLVLKVCPEEVISYFHCRYALAKPEELLAWKQTHERLLDNVKSLCKLVNQRMLLKDLHDTRTCNQLLEPESSDDIWHDGESSFSDKSFSRLVSGDESEQGQNHGYLEAALKFEPGSFSCPVVWEKHFPLHPRLKAGPGKHGASKGVQQLRVVLSAFSVTNRNNMFVYQEESGNVFYLRLHEGFCVGHGTCSDTASSFRSHFDEPDGCVMSVAFTRKSSVASAPERDEDDFSRRRTGYATDRESCGDQTSIASLNLSRSNSIQPRREDCIVLRVHGTTEASSAIKEDLVRVLQNKLDDAVLEVLHGLLSRNPSCKLTADDVHFIQKPQEPPHSVFQFTLQSSALPYLAAVTYYLRQNLMQIVYPPKYMDSAPEHHFQDFSQHPAPETDIFLYNRPHGEGNRGIACVVVALVNGLGNPIRMEEWPRPEVFSPDLYEVPDVSHLVEFTRTSAYERSTSSPGPGPLALLEFKLWIMGHVSIPTLKEKLEMTIAHSLWDIIMEYRLLCYPLCTSSPDSTSHFSLPCSEISTPANFADDEALEDPRARSVSFSGLPPQRAHSAIITGGSGSQDPENKAKLRHASSASHHYANMPHSPVSLIQLRTGIPSSPSERPLSRVSTLVPYHPSSVDLDRYETGDRGILHVVYYKLIPDWLQFGLLKQVSTVREEKFQHMPLHTIPLIIKTLMNTVVSIIPDNALKIFTCTGEHDTPYRPLSSLNMWQKDVDRCCAKSLPFILIGRSFSQWKESVRGEVLAADNVPISLKMQKSYQRYLPLYSPDNEYLLVPRQRFIWISVTGQQMTLLTYNCSKDTQEALTKQCKALVQWHAARWALLGSIAAQKLGLFHNQLCSTRSTIPENLKQNSFLVNGMDVETLIKQQAPPSASMNPSVKRSLPSMFLEAFRDTKSPRLPGQIPPSGLWDPVTCHGHQWLEKRRLEKREELQRLRVLWQTRTSGSNLSVSEDILALFRQVARTIHYCLTPLLFLPKWRVQVASTRDPNLAIMTPNNSASDLTRSRHDSGTSVQSNGKPASPSGSPPRLRRFTDDHWHQSLCAAYIQEYTQYLHTLGFQQLDIKTAAAKRGPKSVLKQHKGSDSELRKTLVTRATLSAQENTVLYFHKSHQGGILICEVAIQEPFFYTKMHALEACRLLHSGSGHSPSSLAHYTDRFLNECDQIKVLLHLHSFTYDFHLRTLHSFVSGRHILLKPMFHVVSFLDDFTKYYNKAPNFARNQVAGFSLSVENRSTPGHQLFNYLLNHEKRYNFRVLRMVTASPDSEEKGTEYVLARQWSYKAFHQDSSESKQLDDYDVTLLVSHDPAAAGQTLSLQLKYYVILTSKRDLYPKIMMEKRLGKFRTVSTTATQPPQKAASAPPPEISGATDIPETSQTILERRESTPSFATSMAESSNMNDVFSTSNPEPIPEESSTSTVAAAAAAVAGKQSSLRAPMLIRQEEINYLGYYTKHEQHMQKIMTDQAKSAEQQIQSVVEKAIVHCRRDTLWQRLQQTPQTSPVSQAEFQELLTLSHTELLSNTEPQLCSLLAQPLSWYQGLAKLLLSKFPENQRNFVAPDGSTQQIVLLNQRLPATAIMLSWDTRTEKAEVCALYREVPPNESEVNQSSDTMLTNRQIAMHAFVEDFVNLCCFHMWMGILG